MFQWYHRYPLLFSSNGKLTRTHNRRDIADVDHCEKGCLVFIDSFFSLSLQLESCRRGLLSPRDAGGRPRTGPTHVWCLRGGETLGKVSILFLLMVWKMSDDCQ